MKRLLVIFFQECERIVPFYFRFHKQYSFFLFRDKATSVRSVHGNQTIDLPWFRTTVSSKQKSLRRESLYPASHPLSIFCKSRFLFFYVFYFTSFLLERKELFPFLFHSERSMNYHLSSWPLDFDERQTRTFLMWQNFSLFFGLLSIKVPFQQSCGARWNQVYQRSKLCRPVNCKAAQFSVYDLFYILFPLITAQISIQRTIIFASTEILSFFLHAKSIPCSRTENLLLRNIVHANWDSQNWAQCLSLIHILKMWREPFRYWNLMKEE